MRLLLFILFLLKILCINAQEKPPIFQSNKYTLTEKDGYPGSTYVHGLQLLPSGLIYAKDFFGNFHITGNNFIKPLTTLGSIPNDYGFYAINENEYWVKYSTEKIVIVKNDTIFKIVTLPEAILLNTFFKVDKKLYAISYKNKNFFLYEFINYTWKLKNEYTIDKEMDIKKVESVSYDIENKIIISYQIDYEKTGVIILDVNSNNIEHIPTFDKKEVDRLFPFFLDKNLHENKSLQASILNLIQKKSGKKYRFSYDLFAENIIRPFNSNNFAYKNKNNEYEHFKINNNNIEATDFVYESKDKLINFLENPYYPYLTFTTNNKPFRVFSYIKKFPTLFDNNNANNIFMLTQDEMGRIWAGSYQNDLSIVSNNLLQKNTSSILSLPKQPYQYMNASLNYNGNIYFIGETNNGGVIKYDMKGNSQKVKPFTNTGFYLYRAPKSKKIFFAGVADNYAVSYCDEKDFTKPNIPWKNINKASGLQLELGIRSITEDTLGRIWMGHPNNGIAIFNPITNTTTSYRVKEKESPMGFVSSLTDYNGTVWMGSDDAGLWFYKNYKLEASAQNIQQINHPLLNTSKRITAMALYKHWLVLACYNKVCILNLDSFYLKDKIILRYLNHQELAFTSFTEQNTMLVSKVDNSVWFSTSDMLYQWDINYWLSLPTYKVNTNIYLVQNGKRTALNTQNAIKLKANENSFEIVFEYLSPDALPRYSRGILAKQREQFLFEAPGLESEFSYKNLSSGKYFFYLDVFEQDGTTSRYTYEIVIQKHLWQHWWFWFLTAIIFLTPLLLWLNTARKKALQAKEISLLNLVTLSNQFRPHFILNTLNSIGADLKDKPSSEKIISKLGESISVIFNYSKKRKVSHSLQNEWLLIENVIHIQQAIYLPTLEVIYYGKDVLETYKNFQLPLGIIELHVENALLHGLRNKRFPPYLLEITLKEDVDNLYFIIKDNGIGITKSKQISSYKKHGTGTQNMNNIIAILNKYNVNKIEILVQENNGTIVTIKIPKNYYYEY